MNRRKAFTLIELLFVVAVIAILAAISVPNFLEAQVRSKVARARTDLSVISLGLGRYYADHGAYPPNHGEVQGYLAAALDNPIMDDGITTPPATAKIAWYTSGDSGSSRWGYDAVDDEAVYKSAELPPLYYNARQLNLLTTPVAYLESSIPIDIFTTRRILRPAYLNSYDLFSNDSRTTYSGLWGQYVTSATLVVAASVGPDNKLNMVHPISGPWLAYDPTNGTVSNGDILHSEGTPLTYEQLRPEHVPERLKHEFGYDPTLMGMF